ncbi:MAG: YqhA family protein [Gammaproteobacteria bacterium]|nr:YqhA family protein [Gammaproteobacteria bacterium]
MLEQIFEKFLWQSRLIVLAAVIASLLVSVGVFYIVTVGACCTLVHLAGYASPELDAQARSDLRSVTVAHVIEIVDGYLLGAVLLIFALGLYELFISHIDAAKDSAQSTNVLLIESLDDLKVRLAKVILIILMVKFFEHVLNLELRTPLEALYLACGIALVGLALYLSHVSEKTV